MNATDRPGNPDLLRHAIDSGRTGDKIDFPDPAAAPLGTDEEAGGVSPTERDVAESLAQESSRTGVKPTPVFPNWPVFTLIAIVALIAAVVVSSSVGR